MDFPAAVRSCLGKYAVFVGRAPRSEYWFFSLFCWVISAAADVIAGDRFAAMIGLALFLPTLAVGWRRMHDINRSGWWSLIMAVPLIGWIFWVIWACTPGERRTNRFGFDPLPDPAPQL
jgi:uncharacterized membrane protein YhaH (DUF805 family)